MNERLLGPSYVIWLITPDTQIISRQTAHGHHSVFTDEGYQWITTMCTFQYCPIGYRRKTNTTTWTCSNSGIKASVLYSTAEKPWKWFWTRLAIVSCTIWPYCIIWYRRKAKNNEANIMLFSIVECIDSLQGKMFHQEWKTGFSSPKQVVAWQQTSTDAMIWIYIHWVMS